MSIFVKNHFFILSHLKMFSKDFVFRLQKPVALLILWKPTGKNPISNWPFLHKYKTRKIPDPSRQKRNALLCRKFLISARVERKFKILKVLSKTLSWSQFSGLTAANKNNALLILWNPNNCETCKNQKDAEPNFLQENVLNNSPSFSRPLLLKKRWNS